MIFESKHYQINKLNLEKVSNLEEINKINNEKETLELSMHKMLEDKEIQLQELRSKYNILVNVIKSAKETPLVEDLKKYID